MHPSDHPSLATLDDLFTYHPPTPEQARAYQAINAASLELARVILENAPDCADRTAAIAKVREARMVANAAIACAPPAVPDPAPNH